MPYIQVRITREGVTTQQKREVIHGVTQVMVDVLGKNPETTFVVIEEVPLENWGIGGDSVSERRKRDRPESQ